MTTYWKNVFTRAWTGSVALVFASTALYLSSWFVIAFFGWWLLVAPIFLKKICCQNCGKAINPQSTTLFGIAFNAGPSRENCVNCGSDLKSQPM